VEAGIAPKTGNKNKSMAPGVSILIQCLWLFRCFSVSFPYLPIRYSEQVF
jgi:hypothetical protein